MVLRLEVEVELVHLVEHLGRAGVLPVDLVQHHDRGEAAAQGLAEHVAGLREWAFGRVDDQQDAVHHGERALDLAAEIGVARRVDQVDRVAFPWDLRRFGEDRDALFSLQVVGVHDPVDGNRPGADHSGGAQHRVDERRLAVVDVCNQGNVADGFRG